MSDDIVNDNKLNISISPAVMAVPQKHWCHPSREESVAKSTKAFMPVGVSRLCTAAIQNRGLIGIHCGLASEADCFARSSIAFWAAAVAALPAH